MRYYTVLVRPDGPQENPDVVLIKEGFCWPALFLPVPWLIWRRLWLGLLCYLAAAGLLAAVVGLLDLGEAGELVVGIGFAVLVAQHANDWRRHTLERQGYRMVGVVAGEDVEAAERRLVAYWSPSRPAVAP